jgi:hypothetical protein
MDKKLSQRQKRQPNGLLQPFTVMMFGRPYPVQATDAADAEKKAKALVKAEQKEEEGDGVVQR